MKKISIITGVYNEEKIVQDVYQAIRKICAESLKGYEYEHIFMDNASTDRTVAILKKIASDDKRVKVLVYSRNFGSIKSEMTGYRYASGEAVVTFEGNLKDPPELIPEFVKQWEKGYEVVYGVRTKTSDTILLALMRKIFYWLINKLSDEKLLVNVGTFRLLDRRVVQELVQLQDYKPYIRGLITSMGFRQIGIPYKRRRRPQGVSKSTLGYLFDFAVNAMISYSLFPIRFCTYIGFAISAVSFLLAVIYVILKLFFWPMQIPALAAVIFLMLIFTGIQLFFLGVIGEYVGAIHAQVRPKPFVIVCEQINFEK